jgi:CheY-like chemotaxis protein
MVSSRPELIIVDDESSIRTTLSLVFTELGYSVRSASDGFSALALIHECEPNILLSDLNMPGMSGFELLSVVRRIHPTIHVVATSGAFSGKSVPHGIAADAFYEKASGLSSLFDAIKQAAQSDSTIRRSSDGATLIWMSPTRWLASDDFYILMGCPRCLRAFPKATTDKQQLVCETECFHCRATISYAIVPIADVGPPPSCSYETIDIDGITVPFDVSPRDRHNPN